jgi:hypothetical protein
MLCRRVVQMNGFGKCVHLNLSSQSARAASAGQRTQATSAIQHAAPLYG